MGMTSHKTQDQAIKSYCSNEFGMSFATNTFDKQLILRTPAESFFCFTVMALLRPSRFFPSPFPRDQPYFFNCVSAKLDSAIGSIAKMSYSKK